MDIALFLLMRLLTLLIRVADIYTWLLFVWVIMKMCISFGILNPYSGFISKVIRAFAGLFEPPLEKIRSVLPSFGGLDFSPLLLYFLLEMIQVGLFRVMLLIS